MYSSSSCTILYRNFHSDSQYSCLFQIFILKDRVFRPPCYQKGLNSTNLQKSLRALKLGGARKGRQEEVQEEEEGKEGVEGRGKE